jgi:hypothetical protein
VNISTKSRRRGVRATVAATALAVSGLVLQQADIAVAATPVVTSANPLVGIASTPSGQGYWQAASDGGVFAFGDAGFYGSMGGHALNKPVVGLSPTPSGKGYWEVASDGGIFAFGDAGFYGSMGGHALNQPVVGIAASPTGKGYWEVASDGGIFAFGDAGFYGSMGGRPLNNPAQAIARTPSGKGYWVAASDGGVFAFGDAIFSGSKAGNALTAGVNAITAGPSGYRLAAVDGSIYAFGGAGNLGRASYTPPVSTSTPGGRAATLAYGWAGKNWLGPNSATPDYWHAVHPPEYWCSDFATYVYQKAGISTPTYPAVNDFKAWAQRNHRWSTDLSHPHIGDAVVYGAHVSIIVDIRAAGVVVTEDGDFSGTPDKGQATFAKTSHVLEKSIYPATGRGTAGPILGYILAG